MARILARERNAPSDTRDLLIRNAAQHHNERNPRDYVCGCGDRQPWIHFFKPLTQRKSLAYLAFSQPYAMVGLCRREPYVITCLYRA